MGHQTIQQRLANAIASHIETEIHEIVKLWAVGPYPVLQALQGIALSQHRLYVHKGRGPIWHIGIGFRVLSL